MDSIASLLASPDAWAALVALVVMEVVLGIDNLVFVSILTNKLPAAMRARARRIGIGLALGLRLALLAFVAFIVGLTRPLFAAFGHGFSPRDLILLAGGLFLVWKATSEIHHNIGHRVPGEHAEETGRTLGFGPAIAQIILLDLVFSIDSIVTAVGMTEHLPIMFAAVIVAVGLMLLAAGPLSRFIERNPTIVMLALAFLLAIGITLIAESFGQHVPKGYIYAAMAFSALVEMLNLWAGRRQARSDG